MRQPTSNEKLAISISKSFYIKKLNFFSAFFQKIFNSNSSFEVDNEETFETLWLKYGLHNNKKIKFSQDEKIDCIDKWFRILYKIDYDLISDFNTEYKTFMDKAKEFHKNNPRTHVSYSFPTPEKFIKKIDERFGPYSKL